MEVTSEDSSQFIGWKKPVISVTVCLSSVSGSLSLHSMRQPASHGAIPAAVNQQAIIAFDDNVVSRREQQLSLMRSAPSQSVSGPIQANTIAS